MSQTGQHEQILLNMDKSSIKQPFRSRSGIGWQEMQRKFIKVKKYMTRCYKSSIGAIVSQTRQQEQIVSTMHYSSIKVYYSRWRKNGWQELESQLLEVKRYITRWHICSIEAPLSQTER